MAVIRLVGKIHASSATDLVLLGKWMGRVSSLVRRQRRVLAVIKGTSIETIFVCCCCCCCLAWQVHYALPLVGKLWAIEAFAKARQAIKPGIDVIKRVPKMDIYSTDGAQPSQVMLTLLRVISK
mgnify:CR=1 FL=1